MPGREVMSGEREAAAAALEERAREHLEALAAFDLDRAIKATHAVHAAIQDCRRASSALEKTRERLARRVELTTNNEEDGRGA